MTIKNTTLFFIAFILILTSFAHTTTQRSELEGVTDLHDGAPLNLRRAKPIRAADSGSDDSYSSASWTSDQSIFSSGDCEILSASDAGSDPSSSSVSWTPPQSPQYENVADEETNIVRSFMDTPFTTPPTSLCASSENDDQTAETAVTHLLEGPESSTSTILETCPLGGLCLLNTLETIGSVAKLAIATNGFTTPSSEFSTIQMALITEASLDVGRVIMTSLAVFIERHDTQHDEEKTHHHTMAFLTKYMDTPLAALEFSYYFYKMITGSTDHKTGRLFLMSIPAHTNPIYSFADWIYKKTSADTHRHHRRVAPDVIDYSDPESA